MRIFDGRLFRRIDTIEETAHQSHFLVTRRAAPTRCVYMQDLSFGDSGILAARPESVLREEKPLAN